MCATFRLAQASVTEQCSTNTVPKQLKTTQSSNKLTIQQKLQQIGMAINPLKMYDCSNAPLVFNIWATVLASPDVIEMILV